MSEKPAKHGRSHIDDESSVPLVEFAAVPAKGLGGLILGRRLSWQERAQPHARVRDAGQQAVNPAVETGRKFIEHPDPSDTISRIRGQQMRL